MTEALSLPHAEDVMHHEQPAPSPARPALRSASTATRPVDIIAPDHYCAALLLEEATRVFPAEIVPGPGWVVRLQPPSGRQWVPEVLALVERWLDSIPLPCTKVFYGNGSYLIRAGDAGRAGAAAAELEEFPVTEAILSRVVGTGSTNARLTGR